MMQATPARKRSHHSATATWSLSRTPLVEDEPDAPTEDIIDVLADAEAIVDAAEPSVVADMDRQQPKQSWWRRRRRGPDDGDEFRLRNR